MFENEKPIYIVAVAFVLIAVQTIVFAEYFDIPNRKEHSFQNRIACTQEAKLCPDGSIVGRTGPNCEFEKCLHEEAFSTKEECEKDTMRLCHVQLCEVNCPANFKKGWVATSQSFSDVSTWKTYRNEEYGFEVRYPPYVNLEAEGMVQILYFANASSSLSINLVNPYEDISDPYAAGLTFPTEDDFYAYLQLESADLDRGISEKRLNINGYPAISFFSVKYTDIEEIYIYHKQRVVRFYLLKKPETEKMIYLIISTFKFINQQNTSEEMCKQTGGTWVGCLKTPFPDASLCIPCECPGMRWDAARGCYNI